MRLPAVFVTAWRSINVVYQLTEPPLRWLRRYIRPIPMGPIAMDVSFIVLYTALVALRILV